MEPKRNLDKFRLREVEQYLAADLQFAEQQVRLAKTEEAKHAASEARDRALKRFSDFAARGIVPKEFLSG